MMKDLQRGASSALDDVARNRLTSQGDELIRGAARLLAELLGVGFAMRPGIKDIPGIAGVLRTTQKRMKHLVDDPGGAIREIFEPIAGAKQIAPDAGIISDDVIREATKQAEKGVGRSKSIVKVLDKLKGNRWGLIGLGVAAGIGLSNIYGGAPEPQIQPFGESPLPHPMMSQRPTDINPAMSPSARIYTSQTQIPMRIPSYRDERVTNTYTNPFRTISYSLDESYNDPMHTDQYINQYAMRNKMFSDF